jgi:hypothetical protein
MLVLYCYDYCLKFICWVYLTKLHYWITRSGWCGIEGQRGTDDRRSGAAPTTSGRRSTDGRSGGSPPTRRWRRDRRTPTTDDFKLLPQDLHHTNNTTSDNKFVLLPPCSIDAEFCSAILFWSFTLHYLCSFCWLFVWALIWNTSWGQCLLST